MSTEHAVSMFNIGFDVYLTLKAPQLQFKKVSKIMTMC